MIHSAPAGRLPLVAVVCVGFACGLDRVLRGLDDDWVGQVIEDMCAVFDTVGRGDNLAWGSRHVAYTHPPQEHGVWDSDMGHSALSWLGWVEPSWQMPAADRGVGHPELLTLDHALRALDVPLMIQIAQIRATAFLDDEGEIMRARGTGNGGALLAGLLQGEASDWLGDPKADGSTPVGAMARAVSARDGAAFAFAVERAHEEYTPFGRRAATEGFVDYLLGWLGESQP